MREVANYANDSTDRLRENANEGGEGVQNPENFANVINGCPLRQRTTYSHNNRCCGSCGFSLLNCGKVRQESQW